MSIVECGRDDCDTEFDTEREPLYEFMNPRRCPDCGDEYEPEGEPVGDGDTDDVDPLERIGQLNDLREAGALSDEEFEEKKRSLLDQM